MGKTDCFVDTRTGKSFREGEMYDRCGAEIVGVDPDDGSMWWGTEHAAWVLHDWWAVVRVSGWIGPYRWDGFFIGTDEKAIDYAESHGVRVDFVESGETGKRHAYPNG